VRLVFFVFILDDDDFFALIVLSFRRSVEARERRQISKLSLPFSSSTSSARASEPLEIKCLCIHYSLVSVRI